MKAPTRRARRAAEQLAYEQIGELELAAYLRDAVQPRVADLRRRLLLTFAADHAPGNAAETPAPQGLAEQPDTASPGDEKRTSGESRN